MIFLSVDDRAAQQRLARIRGRFARFDNSVLQLLEREFAEFGRRQFATRGLHGGKRWANLKSSTVRRKKDAGTYSRGVLRDTMAMYKMIADKTSSDRDWQRTDRGARVTFGLARLGFHQSGTSRMVPREVYPDPLPDTLLSRIRNIVRGYIIEGAV